MSNTHPTHLPLISPQNNPYYVGTLPLIGCDSKSQSVAAPLVYEAATKSLNHDSVEERVHALIGDIGQNIKATQTCKTNNEAPELPIKWDKLTQACVKAKADLEASLSDLENNYLKAYFLKAKKEVLQQHIQAGLAHIQRIYDVTQALSEQSTLDHLKNLQAAMRALETIRSAAMPIAQDECTKEASTQSGALACIWKEIKEFLSPVALAGWALLAQSGLFSREVAQQMPFVGSFISIVWTLINRIELRIEQAKTGDQEKLIEICDFLGEIYMSTVNAVDIAARVQATYDERDKNIVTFDAKAEGLLKNSDNLLEKFTKVEKGYSELRAEIAELKQGIALLLKQSGVQQHTRVQNPT